MIQAFDANKVRLSVGDLVLLHGYASIVYEVQCIGVLENTNPIIIQPLIGGIKSCVNSDHVIIAEPEHLL